MRCNCVILLAVALLPTAVRAQESYKIEVLAQGPPAALAGPIKEVLGAQGYRGVDLHAADIGRDDAGRAHSEPSSAPPDSDHSLTRARWS